MKPMLYENNSNFKLAPYQAWVQSGGKTLGKYYKWRKLRPMLHVLEFLVPKSRKKAVLCFAEPASLDIDTFPWWGHFEIVPVLWDCWPKLWDYTEGWFKKHGVRSAVFTSSQTADEFRRRLPGVNILTITEGIETHLFHGEKPLTSRSIDFLQFGRVTRKYGSLNFGEGINAMCSRGEKTILHTRKDLSDALADSKIVLCVPRCDMQPEIAGGVETLTQRYWECMLSGVIILGRAPKELIDLIGYDPVIHLDEEHIIEQVQNIIANVSDYQELVIRNKSVALDLSDWKLRILSIREWLEKSGYML